MRKFILYFFVFSLFVLADEQNSSARRDKKYKHLKTFSDVLYIVEESYIDPVDSEKLIQGAVKGIMNELDPYSHFLSADDLKRLKISAQGWFKGIGLEMSIKKENLIIISVFKNSSAFKMGLKPGDEVLEINGKSIEAGKQSSLFSYFKNRNPRSPVQLKIKPLSSQKTRKLTLKPSRVNIPSTGYKKTKDGFLYVRIHHFTEQTPGEIRKILRKNKKISGMFLDLRRNPGGSLNAAVNTADLFINKGLIVHIKGRVKEYEKIFRAHSKNTRQDFPLIALIDSYSASAAEVLAGALKDSNRALLVGQTSFGKGSVQALIPVEGGGGLKLTIARYYTPSGRSIHGLGVEPHIKFKKPVLDKEQNFELTGPADSHFHQAVVFLQAVDYF